MKGRSVLTYLNGALVGHVNPPVGLNTLISKNVFLNRPPQSITQLDENRYTALKPYIQLGFQL
jgi:hypothetical protein